MQKAPYLGLKLGTLVFIIISAIGINKLSEKNKEIAKISSERDNARDSLKNVTRQRDSAIAEATAMNNITDNDAKKSVIVLQTVLPLIQNFGEDIQKAMNKLPKTSESERTFVQ